MASRLVCLLVLLGSSLTRGEPTIDFIKITPHLTFSPPKFTFLPCGIEGGPCCEPNFATNPIYGPLVKCNRGLGCDLASRTCVSPCGAPGQACCDGPETRALGWTSDGRVFSPAGALVQNMCASGTCDKPSHRCVACASGPGTACCPPDAEQAVARCVGDHLECRFDPGSTTAGTCFECGSKNHPPCAGDRCDGALKISSRLCVECGETGQPACNAVDVYECNSGCNQHLDVVGGVCRPCGDSGQASCPVHNRAQGRCRRYVDWDGCKPGLGALRGVCQICGGEGQARCDEGCNAGLAIKNGICTTFCGHMSQLPCDGGACYSPLVIVGNICSIPCGFQNMSPCPGRVCVGSLRVMGGVCNVCGSEGMLACDDGCDGFSVPVNGICSRQT